MIRRWAHMDGQLTPVEVNMPERFVPPENWISELMRLTTEEQ